MSSSPELIRAALAPCTTYAFDLDDTLHSFRAASSAAATAVFEHIVASTGTATLHHDPENDANNTATIDAARLRALYATILKANTAHAFVDATRTSDDYRKERFAALLRAAGLSFLFSPEKEGEGEEEREKERAYLDILAATYKSALRAALVLKPGAEALLRTLKARGKRVIVVTEGPRDAQVWTVRELGLLAEEGGGGCVDELVTTGDVGRAKVEEGFWIEVLRRVGGGSDGGGGDEGCGGLKTAEVAVVGDSWERDVVPARKTGFVAVWFCESGHGKGEEGRERVLRIDALEKLREVI